MTEKPAAVHTQTPISAIAGINWPAYPTPYAAQRLTLLHQFEQSQWWPEAELRKRQFKQLSGLVTHALSTAPYYRQKYRQAGIKPGQQLDQESWAKVPLLSRPDIQKAGNAVRSNALPKGHKTGATVVTSGSTGMPVTVVATNVTALFWQVSTLRNHLWHGRDFAKKLAAIRRIPGGAAAYPEGSQGPEWGHATQGVFSTGPAAGLEIEANISQQLDWLQRQKANYLQTYPTNLMSLAIAARQQGIQLPTMEQCITFGELLNPEVRVAVQDAWGIPVNDMYSAMEVGYIALQCPDHDHYHVVAENVLLEVLDSENRPCKPGQIGKVVITSLNNFANPIIRYVIGDHAEVGEPCSCGRGLPVLTRILGRERNMVLTPEGDQYWPAFGVRKATEIAPISQFQLAQTQLDTIEVRIVIARDLTGKEEEKLREHILSRFPYPFNLVFKYVDEIPRSKGGKFEDFRSELTQP